MWVSKTLMFGGTCSARSVLTLVSRWIQRAFRVKRITCRFPAGCLNLMALTFFHATDDEAPAAGKPSGISLLQDYGERDSVRGENVQIVLEHQVQVKSGGSWIKVYAENTDFFDHSVDVDIEIEVEEEGEGC